MYLMSTLVIVESPTKAKTIKQFLPKSYVVKASMGHIRDLPQSASDIPAKYKKSAWANLGVNPEQDFDPLYIIPKDKKKTVNDLLASVKEATEIILATDEDREGESISWHLEQVLKPKVPVHRMVFHEITKEAITKSLEEFREINFNLVHAQETRRILDRLVGYTLSPLLWKKISTGLSAGRVQSVSIRFLVLCEWERLAFIKGSYWDLKANLQKEDQTFEAKLTHLKGQRIATGKDFDKNTGKIATNKKNVTLLKEKEARDLQSTLLNQKWIVKEVEEKRSQRHPLPPFTTSSLQQEAIRKLKISAKDTMRTAQNLYEKGLITYMRTDSANLSTEAVKAARTCVTKMYGKQYLSPEPRVYKTKSKGAQEAHEAIRPSGRKFILPKDTKLDGRALALYDLIWKRTTASQMGSAKLKYLVAKIEVGTALFRSSGKLIEFPGFFRSYVEGSDDPDAALDDKEIFLPELTKGDSTECKKLDSMSHETQPPARYTEASLVKTLENEGIGRPSTYASIISTIMDRGYAEKINDALVPTYTAFAVVRLLEKHFSDLVNPNFTANMELRLDEIASGDQEWLPYLKEFFLGKNGLEQQVIHKTDEIPPGEYRSLNFENVNATIHLGKFGPYIEVEKDGEPITASIPKDILPADIDEKRIEHILRQKLKWHNELGIHPEIKDSVFLLNGTYGPYVQLGEVKEGEKRPKRTSLPKGIKVEDVNLDIAIKLLSLPRKLGIHPENKAPIFAGVGRFGPYILLDDLVNGKDYRSLKAEDNVLDIEMERVLEILSIPKKSRGAASKPLRDLGVHPDDKKPVVVYDGPYGPYVKHGKVNASIPTELGIDGITLNAAVDLLGEKSSRLKRRRSKS